jgi:hypothetical protein
MNDKILQFLKESNAIEKENRKEFLHLAHLGWHFLSAFNHLDPENICATHLLLSIKSDLSDEEKGNFRECEVMIGGDLAPRAYSVPILMDQWITIHGDAKTEKEIKEAHIAFEHIHPFVDFNGRVGRIIMNWQRMKNSLDILVIDHKDAFEYYKWFKK